MNGPRRGPARHEGLPGCSQASVSHFQSSEGLTGLSTGGAFRMQVKSSSILTQHSKKGEGAGRRG